MNFEKLLVIAEVSHDAAMAKFPFLNLLCYMLSLQAYHSLQGFWRWLNGQTCTKCLAHLLEHSKHSINVSCYCYRLLYFETDINCRDNQNTLNHSAAVQGSLFTQVLMFTCELSFWLSKESGLQVALDSKPRLTSYAMNSDSLPSEPPGKPPNSDSYPRAILPPEEHLAMSGDIFCCHNPGRYYWHLADRGQNECDSHLIVSNSLWSHGL